ncbi:ABC transporter permease [Candidatus Woesearchaeota archaeon]|nr:ABC transporter permease [Candidatus Woesearchaeota archaeon]
MKIKNEFRTSFFLSVRYFERNYKQLFFLILVLSFSFVNIVFFSAVNKGLTETLNSQVISYTTGDILIEPREGKRLINNADQVENSLMSIPGIVAVSPRYDQPVSIKKKDKISGTRIIAINPEKEYKVSSIESTVTEGQSIGRYENDEVMIGVEIANEEGGSKTLSRGFGIGIHAGDKIEIEFDRIHKKEYTVKGIFETKFWESDFFVLANLNDVSSLLNLDNQVSYMLVKVNDRSLVDYHKREIQKLSMDVRVYTWREKASFVQQISDSLNIIQVLMFFAGILIASVTIFISMYINIFNRMKFIGVLRAIGVSRRAIITSYLLLALFYCLVGIIFGIIITMIVSNYFDFHPIDLPMGLVRPTFTTASFIVAGLSIIAACIVSTFIPSSSITKKNIIYSIFRGEK